MPNRSPQPNDAPTVQVQTTGAFGQATVKQIQLDSNRLKVKTDSLQRFSNMVAIPSRGVFADSALWILGIAVLIRLPLSLGVAGAMPVYALGLAWGLVALPLLFVLMTVWNSVPDQRPDCFYRFCQCSAAVAIATRFFWLV